MLLLFKKNYTLHKLQFNTIRERSNQRIIYLKPEGNKQREIIARRRGQQVSFSRKEGLVSNFLAVRDKEIIIF